MRRLWRRMKRKKGSVDAGQKSGVLEVNYQRLGGRACKAPYVSASVKDSRGENESDIVQMRVDCGADITCVPKSAVRLPCLLGRPVRTCGYTGRIRKDRTYIVTICIRVGDEVWSFRPKRGVLLRKDDIGLLGMDVLNELSVHLEDEKVTMRRKE